MSKENEYPKKIIIDNEEYKQGIPRDENMLKMTIEEKLENCVKDNKGWDDLVDKLLEQDNIKCMDDFPKLDGKVDIYEFLKTIYNNFFDWTNFDTDEPGCGSLVFIVKWEDCMSIDKMMDCVNKIVFYKTGRDGEEVFTPLHKYNKCELAMMHVIKEIMTRVDRKFNK